MKKAVRILIGSAAAAAVFLGGLRFSFTPARAEEETTDFIGTVLSVAEVHTSQQWNELSASETDIAVVRIADDGRAQFGEERTDITAEQFGSAIPAFYAESSEAANAATELVSEFAPFAFVVSDDPALVKQVRDTCTTAGGIIDFRGQTLSATEMRDIANRNMAKSVIVSVGDTDRETAETLKKQLINVYMEAESEIEYLQARGYGADGILYDGEPPALASETESGVWAGRPLIVSHRGSSGLKRQLAYENGQPCEGGYFENTVESARATYDSFRPDFIEIDLYLSTDGHVVISHDPTLDRTTNGTGMVENMTLAEIRNYKVDGGIDGLAEEYLAEIPLLDDYFEEFENDDLMFLLEIKSAKTACVDAALKVIEKYGMSGRVNFICFSAPILEYIRNKAPEFSVSFLSTGGMYGFTPDSAGEILQQINPMNASFSPTYSNINRETIRTFNRFGMKLSAWTINYDLADIVGSLGFSTFTTDNCELLRTSPYRLTAKDKNATAGVPFSVSATVTFWDGSEEPAACTPLYISDNLSFADGKFTASESGTATVVLAYRSEQYAVISDPITVTISAESAKTDNGNGCGSFADGALALLAAALPLSLFATTKKRNGGKK